MARICKSFISWQCSKKWKRTNGPSVHKQLQDWIRTSQDGPIQNSTEDTKAQKCLAINHTADVEDLYQDSFKIVKKEIEDYLNVEIRPCSFHLM